MAHCIKCNSITDNNICDECLNKNRSFDEKLEEVLSGIEDNPLTEKQQSLINYLRSNADDLEELFDEEWEQSRTTTLTTCFPSGRQVLNQNPVPEEDIMEAAIRRRIKLWAKKLDKADESGDGKATNKAIEMIQSLEAELDDLIYE